MVPTAKRLPVPKNHMADPRHSDDLAGVSAHGKYLLSGRSGLVEKLLRQLTAFFCEKAICILFYLNLYRILMCTFRANVWGHITEPARSPKYPSSESPRHCWLFRRRDVQRQDKSPSEGPRSSDSRIDKILTPSLII